MRIALIAHNGKKNEIVQLAKKYTAFLKSCELMATGTTGQRLQDEVGLEIDRLHSGPYGGDLQLAARLVDKKIDAVIFLRDPMTPQPHEPDINALIRACDVHDVICATNVQTATVLLEYWQSQAA